MRHACNVSRCFVWLATVLGALIGADAISPALAGGPSVLPVTSFITVQPIDVCSTPTSCAAINNINPSTGQLVAGGAVGQTVLSTGLATGNVGYIDPTTRQNVTRAILNQIGVDVSFLPTSQFISPSGTNFSILHVNTSNTNQLTSNDFRQLSQQAAISTGTVPSPTSPAGVPVSSNPTTINMFFVNQLQPIGPNCATCLFGFSWINNNGIAIAQNSILGLATARPDTVAHEIAHNLDLNHGPNTTFPNGTADNIDPGTSNNLLTAGDTRTKPSLSNPVKTLGVNSSNQIVGQGTGTTDQLTSRSSSGLPPGGSQQTQILTSGFIHPIPEVATSVGSPASLTVAAASLSGAELAAQSIDSGADPDVISGPLPVTSTVQFNPSGNFGGRPNEFLEAVQFALPTGYFFRQGEEGDFSFTLTGPGASGIQVFHSFDCGYITSCLEVDLRGAPFTTGDEIDFTALVCRSDPSIGCALANLNDLTGTYTYLFSDGFETTSRLMPVDDLFANSLLPDLTIPSTIFNFSLLMNADAGILPCTPTAGVCPDLVLADLDPAEEGTAPVPEPSSLLLLVVPLGIAAALNRRRRAPFVTLRDYSIS